MDFLTTIKEQPESFIQPRSDLHDAALQLAQKYLNPLARQITSLQTQRLHEVRKSRKRKRANQNLENEAVGENRVLRMRQVYTDGFDFHQVWYQAAQVLDAAGKELRRSLPSDTSVIDGASSQDSDLSDLDGEVYREIDDESIGEEGVDWVYDADEASEDAASVTSSSRERDTNHTIAEDLEDSELASDFMDDDAGEQEGQSESFVKDPNGLNDGFFSIDNFNKRTQFLEQQDERGDPDDGAASDEEDIDWTVDPLLLRATPAGRSSRSKHEGVDDEDESDEDDDGPTFGNANLSGIDHDSDEDEDEDSTAGLGASGLSGAVDDFSNTNNILYSDFFAPPAKNVPKSKKQGKRSGRFQERGNSVKQQLAKEDDEDDHREEDDDGQVEELERAMAGVQRDLFDDESDLDSEENSEETEMPPGQRNLSSHERKQLALRAEIRRLEAETVAEKAWAMSGETVAPARPQNALLEEDLDFERAGKPVPIITTEINESIEDLIKRRILAKEFDEVRRRRPDDVLNGDGKAPRRGPLEEISDARSKKGLAEEYEEDYLRKSDPNFIDTRSEALKKQHKEIEQQWAEVRAELDALSNWHYKPRPVAPSLDVRVDIPTVALEDARPAAGSDVGAAAAIAPQELYSVGADGKRANEVISKGGTVAGRDEETQDQRKRRRRRQKERRRKMEGNKAIPETDMASRPEDGQAKRAKRSEVVSQLKKGGVKVIGRKGELHDVDGNAVRKQQAQAMVSNYRL